MVDYKKPLPAIHEETRPFWEKAKKHELWLQKCRDCGKFRFYPRSICPNCFSYNTEWSRVSGRGKIYSFTVSNRPPLQAFQKDVPYCLALVDLEEGVRMMTNIVECQWEDLKIDMPVEVVFEDVTPLISLPKFRPTPVI
ncbi:MAG: Zn-ribbon domain-containing OB-fold protein [Dehalococcoidia bacterium]|nr:Zn-ribbon domain-containing OB-fold protein [Dehalococcoidia bacterium]